jgi:hypothetical protein
MNSISRRNMWIAALQPKVHGLDMRTSTLGGRSARPLLVCSLLSVICLAFKGRVCAR